MSHSFLAHDTNYYDISTPEELKAVLLRSSGRSIVRFYRLGCPACDASVGLWLELSRRPENRAHMFISVDVLENKGMSWAMGVEHIPTYMCLQRGRQAVKLVGADPDKLRRLVEIGTL
jgi:thiol-disulfide isomerase/thioredoxin